jgi:hypothetical protein
LRDEFHTIQNRRTWNSIGILFLVSLFLFCGRESADAASNVVEVPVALSLPPTKRDLDATLAKYLGQTFASGYQLDQSISDVTVRDPFEIRLSGIRIRANLLGRTEIDSRGVIGEAVLRNLKISIDRVSIHTVIRTDVTGVDARIRLDADCSNTLVDWKNAEIPVFLRAEIKVGSQQPILDVEGLTLSTLLENSAQPEMTMNCVGPAGIESVLRDQAWRALIARWTDTEFLNEVQSAIEASVNAGLRPGGEGFMISSVADAGMKLQLKSTSYKSDARGAHLMGLLRFELDRPSQEVPAAINPETLIPSAQIKSLTISVATEAAEALLQSYFAPGVWNLWVEGRDIAGFRDLMSSRFSQFFAFPALMDFPKDAPIAFSASFTSRLTLRCNSRSELRLRAPIGAWMVLQDRSQLGFKPLVNFSMPTVLDVNKSMIGKPGVSIQQIELSSEFHQKYLDEDRPNTTIAHDTILERLQPAIESEIESFLSTSQLVQATAGLTMACEPASQTMRPTLRFTAP